MKAKIMNVSMVLMVIGAISLTACNSNKKETPKEEQTSSVVDTAHNSRNALDYEGTYTGTLPCADCSGIYTEITLTADHFKKKTVYQGKEEANTFEVSGKFSWNEKGSAITLDNDQMEQFQVGENLLFVLDADGKRITGELAELYILRKK
ncbi:copper resistance protein NlpE [Parabacteroides sp. PF5-6]|uniref:copper resistance protein NlpE n=1 Tax=Parabacteroides sp. PF5-6 TaxID=1742403 RepID=UPI00240667A8|nr:copper resistance protein NlpE [Parabacteroides sp. PF5-6]MDF9831232.1 putative lipoprotein NlpE involved in copper resistance [Parabacteroides sp. PF5-6]